METSIISQVARKVFVKSSNIPKELQDARSKPASDSISISKEAQSIDSNKEISEFDKNRQAEVIRVKSLVMENKYSMSDEVIDKIAERIANMLL